MSRDIDTSWVDRAACRTSDPESFFPEVGQQATAPKKVCEKRCYVREQCLRWALGIDGNAPEEDGVWGGKSRRERLKIRRELGLTGSNSPAPGPRPQVALDEDEIRERLAS